MADYGRCLMRRAAKVDRNHAEIVDALRRVGCSVQSLATIGAGVPDLLVGYRGFNWLIEVKDGKLPPSKKSLTDDEAGWHNQWQGQVAVAYSAEDAIRIVGVSV
jgi:hypothetical protein